MINIIQLYKTSSEFNQWEIWYSTIHTAVQKHSRRRAVTYISLPTSRGVDQLWRNCFRRWQCCFTQVRNGEGSTIL